MDPLKGPERPRKRQRVSRACDSCRGRKTACDGRRPVCLACTSRGAEGECRWTFVPKRESERWENGTGLTLAPPASNGPQLNSPETMQSAQQNGRSGQQPEPRLEAGETPLEDAFSSAPSDGLATFPGGSDSAAYGPSSTIAFLRHVIAKGSRPVSGAVTPNGGPKMARNAAPRLAPVRPVDSGQAVLPLRRSADDFLACYWEFVHPVFPLLHKTSFIDQYERFWASSKGDRGGSDDIEEPMVMAILNLVFALGCKYSTLVHSSQKSSTADEFYQRTRVLSEFSILDAMSIATVQMLALSGVYLQSTQYASRCWNSVGLAIRAAQSLGLHSESRGVKASSQLEREIRRRVWHTCVSLDRLLSMTFGRPAMVDRPNDVPLPLMIDDEYLSSLHEGEQPQHIPSRLGAFVFSRKLFDLLGLVLSFLSSPALHATTQTKDLGPIGDVLAQVLELNRKLDVFSESVPPYLRKTETTSPFTVDNDNHVHLQQRVLHCRLMLVRLLLLRPLLLMSNRMQRSSTIQCLDGTAQSSLDAELVRTSCNLCLTTAYSLVDAIYFNLSTLYRSSGWHTVYFTFSAAIVLLASIKCPLIEIASNSESEKFETCWERCMAVFEHYRDQIHSAAHGILVLKTIRAQLGKGHEVTPANSKNQPTPDNASIEASPGIPGQYTLGPGFTLEDFDPFGLDNISDAWFGQQLTNLDWLELPEI